MTNEHIKHKRKHETVIKPHQYSDFPSSVCSHSQLTERTQKSSTDPLTSSLLVQLFQKHTPYSTNDIKAQLLQRQSIMPRRIYKHRQSISAVEAQQRWFSVCKSVTFNLRRWSHRHTAITSIYCTFVQMTDIQNSSSCTAYGWYYIHRDTSSSNIF